MANAKPAIDANSKVDHSHLDCVKIRLGTVEYNNDPRGCGAASVMWQVASGGNPAVYTDWEVLFDGDNIIPAGDNSFTVTSAGNAGWNQNFDLTNPILNANNPGKGTWNWFNKGKPCYRIWSLVTDAESASKWGTFSVTITRNGVVRYSTAEPLVTVSDDIYFDVEKCGECGEDKDVNCFDPATGELITDLAQFIADATGFDKAQIETAFPSDADGTTDEKLKACAKPCSHVYPEVVNPEPILFEGCDNGTTPATNVWYQFVDGQVVAFVTDADDALVEYTMIGDLVDCQAGEVIPDPKECTLDDLAGECGAVDECTEIGKINDTNNGLGISGSGTATHTIKHAPSTQATTDQVNAWVLAGYVVVIEFASGATAVVDAMNFYSATSRTFVARADHTAADPCNLFSQAVDGSGVNGEAVTYTAYQVAAETVEPEKVLKTEIVCQRNPLEVTIVDEPAPEKTIQSNLIAGCDDVDGDPDNIVVYYRNQTICYFADGSPPEQTLSDPFDANLDPYTVINDVPCDPQALGADPEPFCDNGTTFIRFTISLMGASVVVVDVEQDGVTPYTPEGPVTAGVCPVFAQDPNVEQCGTKGTALVGTGRGGINRPEHSNFFLGTIGPADSFAELQTLAAESGYTITLGPYILPDGTVISDGGLLCVTGAPEIGSLTYLNGLSNTTVNIFLGWEERWAQLVKGCKEDEILAKLCSIESLLDCPPADECDNLVSKSDISAGPGTYNMTDGTMTLSGGGTTGYTGSPTQGCGDVLATGAWGSVGSTATPVTLTFSAPVDGVRLYLGNVNPLEQLTLSQPADAVTVSTDTQNCPDVVFDVNGYQATASHALSSHIVDYQFETPITTLTLTHNQLGAGVLLRVEALECAAAALRASEVTATDVTVRGLKAKAGEDLVATNTNDDSSGTEVVQRIATVEAMARDTQKLTMAKTAGITMESTLRTKAAAVKGRTK